jgi:hypothetical protein
MFGKSVLPVLAAVTLLVIVAPSSLWASATVPEIDPSSTGIAAIALIAGAVLMIRGRRKN